VEASQKHGSFDMRWPRAGTSSKPGRESRTPPARLRLVPPQRPSGADPHEREEAAAQRLMAAMAATRQKRATSSRP
jgi:hypothetical protein